MVVAVVAFVAVFVAGLALGAFWRRPFVTGCVAVGAFTALLVLQSHEPFVAFSAFALIGLAGLVADSVRETLGIISGR